MDFNQLTPSEFEELTSRVFHNRGFRTFLTPGSGDGGIDIEATYDGEIFKGTYLIQCKLWKNNVGEPQIRDLYGVVQSQNALKGILVTSSDFSLKARQFAENKNIDLINGDTLRMLLKNNDTNANIKPTFSSQIKGFLEDDSFDNELYDLLVNEIENNPSFEQPYMKMLELLFQSVIAMGGRSALNGLFNEIIYYSKRYRDNFTKRKSNGDIGKRVGIDYMILLIYLLKGELTKVYSQITSLKASKFKGNKTLKSYHAGLPSNYQKYITQLEEILNRFISDEEIVDEDTIPFTFSFYFFDDTFIQSIRAKTQDIKFNWIVPEFSINENEEVEQQKQLLKAIYVEQK